jgi:hypothetical protein
MDHQSIIEKHPAPPAVEGNIAGASANRTVPPSVSAGMVPASSNQRTSAKSWPCLPGEDAGPSLAAMAYRDLDAALQLLAERAQYITGASGAMIALRRGEHNDMLCRATIGSSAPDLGALLSTEYGFSGESVRTRQALRCDDAELDPRVNREICRRLGIASVVVMPILGDQQALGVFELFSGKPRAFEERDLSALRRLSAMVGTAVKYAVATQTVPAASESVLEERRTPVDEVKLEVETVSPSTGVADPNSLPAPAAKDFPPGEPEKTEPEKTEVLATEASPAAVSPIEARTVEPEKSEPKTAEAKTAETKTAETKTAETKTAEPIPKKPLFWSAAIQTPDTGSIADAPESIPPPAVLKNLSKCQACGFPVSQGRTFCVECEEKQWRGQVPKQTSSVSAQTVPPRVPLGRVNERPSGSSPSKRSPSAQAVAATRAPQTGQSSGRQMESAAPSLGIPVKPQTLTAAPPEPAAIVVQPSAASASDVAVGLPHIVPSKPEPTPASGSSVPFLASTLEPESWLSANKYVLGALLLIVIAIAAFAVLR